MAILATSRRWLVTSWCAASRSSCSRQRLANMYSSCGSSIGNLRISARYLERPDSPLRTGKLRLRAILSALQWFRSPTAADPAGGRLVKADRAAMFRVGYSTQVQHTLNAGPVGSKTAVTFPCGCHKLLAWNDFLHASASFCRSQGVLQEKQILRQRRLPAQNFPGAGVLDGKQIRVQRLPPQGRQRGLGARSKRIGLGLEMRAVDGIAQQRVPDMGQMHPDLVGAAGFQLAGEQRGNRLAVPAIKRLRDLPMRHGLSAALAHRHLLPRMR